MRRASSLLLVGALTFTGACSNDDDAGPTPTPDPTAPTTIIDRSGIALAGVPGQTTSTIVERGKASLVGSVQGPGGLVVGATVRIERLVAGREIRSDVLTGPDGRFLLGGVPGGRYRVRAFLAPSLAQIAPEVRFLSDGEEHSFDLVVEQQSGLVVRADVAPEPPLLGGSVNLVASVANRTVDVDGVVRSTPVVGATVELVGLGRWALRDDAGSPPDDETSTSTSTSSTSSSSSSSSSTSVPFGSTTSTTSRTGRSLSPTGRTDGSGRVRYELRCEATGEPGLALRIPVTVTPPPDPSGAPGTPRTTTETIALDLPACVDPTTLTTTTTIGPSTTESSTTTKP